MAESNLSANVEEFAETGLMFSVVLREAKLVRTLKLKIPVLLKDCLTWS